MSKSNYDESRQAKEGPKNTPGVYETTSWSNYCAYCSRGPGPTTSPAWWKGPGIRLDVHTSTPHMTTKRRRSQPRAGRAGATRGLLSCLSLRVVSDDNASRVRPAPMIQGDAALWGGAHMTTHMWHGHQGIGALNITSHTCFVFVVNITRLLPRSGLHVINIPPRPTVANSQENSQSRSIIHHPLTKGVRHSTWAWIDLI